LIVFNRFFQVNIHSTVLRSKHESQQTTGQNFEIRGTPVHTGRLTVLDLQTADWGIVIKQWDLKNEVVERNSH